MDYDSFLELAKERRTIRRFKPDPVPDEYVAKIVEAARWAPSGYNLQPWEFVVVRDKELKDTIVGWIDDYWPQSARAEKVREAWQRQTMHPWRDTEWDYRNAPVYIIVFGDTRTQAGLPMMVRYDRHRRDMIHTSSLANAYLYMGLAATTLGLASEWMSVVATSFMHGHLKELLGVPELLEIYDMMALGYPAYAPRPKLLRDREEIVHYDYCGADDFRTDEEVRDFIRRTRAWVTANHRRGVDREMVG